MILIHENLAADHAELLIEELGPAEMCSTIMYPSRNKDLALLITGIYIPPGRVATIKMGTLKRLSPHKTDELTNEILPRLEATIRGMFADGWRTGPC